MVQPSQRRKPSNHRAGESYVHNVPCVDAGGTPCQHRVKVMADGHIAVLDHPRGEPQGMLRWYELAGERPCGCYAALAAMSDDARWPPVDVVSTNGTLSVISRLGGQHRKARVAISALRGAVRAGSCHVCLVDPEVFGGTWVAALDTAVATAVARLPLRYALAAALPVPSLRVAGSGFVHVRVPRRGAVLWDVALPGMADLADQFEEPCSPGGYALVRLTRRLLASWRGVLPRRQASSSGASPSGRPRPDPCRSSP